MKTWIIPTAALAVGAIGGFISGKGANPDQSKIADLQELSTRAQSRPKTNLSEGSGAGSRKTRAESVEEIFKNPGLSSRIQGLMDYYGNLSPEQLASEAAKLENLPMNERMMASMMLFSRWGEVDPVGAMAHANSMGFAGAFARPTIMQSWASVDPANAAKYFTENPGQFAMMGGRGPMGQSASSIIASEWAKHDPSAALAWASTLTQGKSEALSSVLSELAKSDPTQATQLLAGLSAEDQARAIPSLAHQFGVKDFDQAKSWISSLPTDQQGRAMAEAIEGLAGNDINKAMAELNQMPDSEAKNRLIPDLVGKLAQNDPKAAASLIAAQSDERVQARSVRDLMQTWVAQSPSEALEYARSQPQGQLYDSAVSSFVFSNRSGDPKQNLELAGSISDDRSRMMAVGMAVRQYAQTDRAAAEAAVQTLDLPEGMKQRLLNNDGPAWGGRGQGGRGPGGRGQGGSGGR